MSAALDITCAERVITPPAPEGQRWVEAFVKYANEAHERAARGQQPPFAYRTDLDIAFRERGAQLAQVITCELGELRDRIAELEQQLDHAQARASDAEHALNDAGARFAATRGIDQQALRALCLLYLDATDPR